MEVHGNGTDAALKAAGLDAVYVTHYTPYSARKEYMKRSLDRVGLQASFITSWDREALDDEDVACMYPSSHLFEKVARSRNFAVSWLLVGELGLSMKHAAAYYDAVQRGHRNILVLEDDAVFADGFAEELETILRDQQVSDYDILFLGSYFGDNDAENSKAPHIARDGGSKGAVGYLVSLKGARHLMGHMPITGPADHMISNGGSYPNPPPVRYSRRPWLVWQGSRDATWRKEVQGDYVSKGQLFAHTKDTQPCAGCACPAEVTSVSEHILRPGRDPAVSLRHHRRMRAPGRGPEPWRRRMPRPVPMPWLSREEMDSRLGLDEDYLSAYIDAGYACSAVDVLRLELAHLNE